MDDFVDILYAPMAYPVWWLVGAVLVAVAAVAWVAGIYLWTAPVDRLRRIPIVREVTYRVLRLKFMRSLGRVAERHRAGGLDSRTAFHEISRIFRQFVAFRTGYHVREMTAADIARSPLAASVLPVLERTYPGQFDTADPAGVDAAVAVARTAVARWT
ncbi:hypothetical protein CRI77_02765 [Mycolicibacterium duvalii]|uniref:Uncharacterized protein n=1 Tax=Mycolicibacterium duvalii TaxID=39688 RepID=A0A7I7JYA1_9MYCO|nr:hypothetical protein [Mycolicibacterium duvalii]MCV7366775.1 hypothetical protein [Mycolicibacterium duvalii]PEG43907.1 hypothetical protein CRI77_02765 [Mycolicibacterium duvalii]BBX16763.1 hypothetical protein MDUV_16230 [Mycolicibacterium duvalii]